MADDIYENVIGSESEGMNGKRVEGMEEMYVNADSVRNHDFRRKSNTQQPLQMTGNHFSLLHVFVYCILTAVGWLANVFNYAYT